MPLAAMAIFCSIDCDRLRELLGLNSYALADESTNPTFRKKNRPVQTLQGICGSKTELAVYKDHDPKQRGYRQDPLYSGNGRPM